MYIKLTINGKFISNISVDDRIFDQEDTQEERKYLAEEWLFDMMSYEIVEGDINEAPTEKEMDNAIANLNEWFNK